MPAPAPSLATAARLRARVVSAIADIPRDAWNSCANPFAKDALRKDGLPAAIETISQRSHLKDEDNSELQGYLYNPFMSYDFLHALEASSSATWRTGWQPQHILIETPGNEILAVAPCYLKSHSRGEYVFDHGWAEAYERAGGRYYPKLQVAVPFTPAAGRRLLTKPGAQEETTKTMLATALMSLCGTREASSAHVTFLPEREWGFLGARGFLQRTDQQFHWHNDGYSSFEDFLAALASRKRKIIRRERREALAAGITVDWLTGIDLTESVWDAFFGFYMDTGSRKWGRPYLTRAFFSLIGETMRDQILLVMAKRNGRYIAGAINFIGASTLFGRHWGAVEPHPFLHFELCYYQAIEFAIARGLARVEAGAQGEHKLSRGYVPVTTYSAHYIADPDLRRAVANYLENERTYVQSAIEELAAFTPFRKNHAEG